MALLFLEHRDISEANTPYTVQNPLLTTSIINLVEFIKSQTEASNLFSVFLMMNPHREDQRVIRSFVFRVVNKFYMLLCLAFGHISIVLF